MKVKVNVTRADIQAGVRKGCVDCPVARAVLRVLEYYGVDHVNTYYSDIDVRGKIIRLPREARSFIKKFDKEKSGVTNRVHYKFPKSSFKPFSFYLNIAL